MADNFNFLELVFEASVKQRHPRVPAAGLQSLHQGGALRPRLLPGEEDHLRPGQQIGQDWLPQ